MIRALVVHPDKMHEVVEVEPTLENMRGLIGGGWLEGVGDTIGSDWHAYADEEGRLKGQPVNPVATVLARRLGWPGDFLVGTVAFLGSDGTEEADVPDRVLALLD